MEIEKKLYDDIKSYCKLNNLKVNSFINNLLKKAFNVEKYGESPFVLKKNTSEKNNNLEEDKVGEKIVIDDLEENSDNSLIENDINLVDNNIKLVIKEKKKRKLN